MSKAKVFSFSLPLLFVLASMAIAGAGTIYVPDDYSSIQEAVDAASSGDTVVIRDGIYTENVNIKKDHLTLRSEHGAERTVVEAANTADETFQVTADYVTVQGFTVRLGSAGIFLNGADYCNIFGNIIFSNSRRGIHLFRSSHNNLTENNASSNSRDGIYLEYSSNNNTLEGNTVSGNSETGIYLLESSNNTLTENTTPNNDYGIYLRCSPHNNLTENTASNNSRDGIHLFRSSHNNLTENTASNNSRDGIYLEYSSNENTLKRNTVSGNSQYGIYLKYSSNNRIYFNSFTGNSESVSSIDSTNTWTSSIKVTYAYHGSTYANYLGNYWADYTGEDADDDGIGDGPYTINSDQDDYPLMEALENYILFISISELK
ncbi:hypothetical protein ES703_59707 [subsurface metagenome]